MMFSRFRPPLSKRTRDFKQNGTQEKTQFSDPFFQVQVSGQVFTILLSLSVNESNLEKGYDELSQNIVLFFCSIWFEVTSAFGIM